MLNQQTYADIQVKINEVCYLWKENFRFDLDRFLNKLSLKQPSAEESVDHSFGSVFFKPKNHSSYGFEIHKSSEIEPPTLGSLDNALGCDKKR